MLQICSGKLFTNEAKYKNTLTGVIYTNLRFTSEQKIETDIGSIIPTTNLHESNAIIYELNELIENFGDGPGIIISNGISSYILDFSSILSFALSCIATPNYSLTERLLSDQLSVSTYSTPKNLIKRVFDKTIYCNKEDEEFFIKFTKQLIGLKRKTYLEVMRSIKTYVTGMQRITDDFELAYTLFVASVESLAQDFDLFQPTWDKYDPTKKSKIENALNQADEITSNNIKNVLLSIEHSSLNQRFQEFSIKHTNGAFFRQEAIGTQNPISKRDLQTALKNAYQARSMYIHKLRKLPKQLVLSNNYTETSSIDNKTWLTLQGISKLAKHIIIEFIMNQATIHYEPYNYSHERANTIQLKMSPEYWIGQIDFQAQSGVKKLEGFLHQLTNVLNKNENATLSNLAELLTELENRIDSLKSNDKQSFIALYIIYNYCFPEQQRLKNSDQFINKYKSMLFSPSPAALITNFLCAVQTDWNLEEHHNCLDKYFLERDYKLNFRCPAILESGIILNLAERYRVNQKYDDALDLIKMAVENMPGHIALQQFEKNFTSAHKIDPNQILFPQNK